MKNIILKTIAVILAAIFLLTACSLDSFSWIPFILCCISFKWLVLFAYANGLFGRFGK